jgi:predicted nucleic acid-binding Zn ribbon protein
VERLDSTAPRALRAALAAQPDSPGKVQFAWTLAAGPALSRAATVTWRNNVLLIDPRTESWRRELLRARPVLLARLASLLGPDVVRTLQIVGGKRVEP